MINGQAVNLTASGVLQPNRCQLVGFYVNSTSAGTIVLRNGDSGGTAVSGTITPAVGWHFFPAALPAGGYATIGGTLNVTFIVKQS
jgi:hypothetical protein